MKYFVFAVLLFACGVGLTRLKSDEEQAYVAVVRMRTMDGMFLTFVHSKIDDRKACARTIELFSEPLKACPKCTIESTECATQLTGIDKAVADNQPVPLYTVSTGQVRISIVGPPNLVNSECEFIASNIIKRGLKTAACVYPGQDPTLRAPRESM